jgi:tetratricopeptide (TPR) repeat protein
MPAKPTEFKDRTYRTLDGKSVIAIVSSEELEIREGGENIVCKYTEKDNKLRVVMNAIGTTRAMYYNITPQGLVGEHGEILYDSATYQSKQAFESGAAAFNKRDFKKAIADLSEAIRLDPQNLNAYDILAMIYENSGNLAKAIDNYSEIVHRSNGGGLTQRGWAYFRNGTYDKALADFNEEIRQRPAAEFAWNDCAWFLAVCPEANYRNGNKAVEYAKKACEISEWNNRNYFITLAASYAEAGNFDEAIKWQKKALETNQAGQAVNASHEQLMCYENKQPYHLPKKMK